jgi:hypothetical protein
MRYPPGEFLALLEKKKGIKWPDVLGDGANILFTVSERVLEAWEKENIGSFPIHRVHIQKPYPKKMGNVEPPVYYWLDGKKMKGADLDLEASGYVNGSKCPGCNRVEYDLPATYELKHSKVIPYVFKPGSWNGSNLFTIDITYRRFFCTEAVLECARKYKFLNFRFTPIELGDAISHKGIDYLKKK